MACSTFDGQLVRQESELRDLMSQFVCVRLVQGNGMDLALFQFDYDLTLAAFFLNADRTIYGRFGTRSTDKDAARDISIEGLRKAMAGALALHQDYPANKALFSGKQGGAARVQFPEDYPSLKGRFSSTITYTNQVARSCIHCHMVRDADRAVVRITEKFFSDRVLYPYPMPNEVGLAFDPREMATVLSVAPGSSAQKDGFKAGDKVVSLEGQPLLSIADVQWVLENATEGSRLEAEVEREGKRVKLPLTLAKGWRRHSDISWRPTSWDLRRMAFGGMKLEELTAEERKEAKIQQGRLALQAKHVGEFGEHALAKKAGFKKGDIIVAFDGRTEAMSESELFGYVLQKKAPASRIPVSILRGEEKLNLDLTVP